MIVKKKFLVTVTVEKSIIIEAENKDDACDIVWNSDKPDYDYMKEYVSAENIYKLRGN